MKKLVLFSFIATLAIGTIGISGANAQSAQTQAQLAAQLALQIQNIRSQVNQLIVEQGANYPVLTRTLAIGSRGDDVEVLQALLAADADIYPQGLITGYYGSLTTSAVARFQTRMGLAVTGRVDAATLAALRARQTQIGLTIELDSTNNMRPCFLSATVAASAHWTRGGVAIVTMCQAAASGSVATGTGSSTNVAGAFTTNNSLSGLFGSALSPSSITLNWTSPSLATHRVFLSTSSPVNTANATVFANNSATSSPSINIAGLAPNTRYYYVVETRDAAGNVNRSIEYTFMTPAATSTSVSTPTSTAGATTTNSLNVSGVNAANLSSSGATISWMNNMNAATRVFYSSCPFNMNGATVATFNGSNTSGSVNLSGLNANTTYCFVVQSTDANGNVVTSPQFTFTTSGTGGANNTGNNTFTISGINVIPTSTGGTVTWNTSANADGRVFVSTSFPVNTSNAQSFGSVVNLRTNQTVDLSGLTPNTTYYIVVQSRDISGNVVTATSQFRTNP